MPPIGKEINYYKWWTMAMVVVVENGDGEIGRAHV